MPAFSGLFFFRRYREINTDLDVDIEMVRYISTAQILIYLKMHRLSIYLSIYLYVYLKGNSLIKL